MAWRRIAVLLPLVAVLAGCSGTASGASQPGSQLSSTVAPSPSQSQSQSESQSLAAPPGQSLVATARAGGLTVYDAAGGRVMKHLSDRARSGGPLTVLVLATRPGWLQVLLPGRPNGRSGWVEQSAVQMAITPWRLVISESTHTLDVLKSGRRVQQYPVGVGKAATPTVHGTFFVTELIRPPDPKGAYGPYAFGLSAYSDVLTSFAGGPGQLGLHGTDRADLVGTDVSHGCLRVTNKVITTLARTIPLGTPVDIRP